MIRKIYSIIIVCFFITINFYSSFGQDSKYRAHRVYFYSFTKYMEWPPAYTKNEFVIGVLGESDLTPLLQEMAEIKKVKDAKIVVKKITIDDLDTFMNMLFVPDNQIGQFQLIKNTLKNRPTLIITETPSMASRGAMINFKDVNGNLRFEVNQSEMNKVGIKVSKELLRFGEEIN